MKTKKPVLLDKGFTANRCESKDMNKLNLALFRKIKAWIRKHPTQFWMASFFSKFDPSRPWRIGGCGTAGCIAALALFLSQGRRKKLKSERLYREALDHNVQHQAQNALGLNEYQAARLFYRHRWPAQFERIAPTAEADARRGIARIDHFIKTKGTE